MNNYPVTRTPEQGHTAGCLAKALICAVQNMRDANGSDDHEMRLMAQNNTMLVWADKYLAERLTQCYCPPIAKPSSPCKFSWNPGTWPFTKRCKIEGTTTKWVSESCDADDVELIVCAGHGAIIDRDEVEILDQLVAYSLKARNGDEDSAWVVRHLTAALTTDFGWSSERVFKVCDAAV